MKVRPQLQALLLADHIYVDAATGKKVIAGTFNHLVAQNFPSTTDVSRYALVSLTDVHGHVAVILRFVDLSTGDTLLELQGIEAEADDPLETVELVVEIPPLPMPHAGTYAFEAHWNGELLGSLRVFIEPRSDDS